MSTTSTLDEDLEIALPPHTESFSQDEEWCVVHWNGEWQKLLIHDYAKIFSIPGLYERLIYDTLDCRSPSTVCRLLKEETARTGVPAEDLRVLDLGAGNGMVAEVLKSQGIGSVVGIDIINEAKEAARRDRPRVYDDYRVLDMTSISETDRESLLHHRMNCLVCVAALGFGDIPPAAFTNSFNLIQPGGWVALNIKEEFLGKSDDTGFSKLIHLFQSNGALDIKVKHRYQHRIGTNREPIHYLAMVGQKKSHAPVGISEAAMNYLEFRGAPSNPE